MYINDETFKKLFKETLETKLTKKELVDLIMRYTNEYQLENILQEVLGINEVENDRN